MKKSRFVLLLALACVVSFMWLSLSGEGPKKYIEIFEASGFTVVKTSSRLNFLSEHVIVTHSMNQFADSMTRWETVKLREPGGGVQTNETIKWALGSNMRDPIIYWHRDSQHGLVFYYINIQGRSIVFKPG